MGGCCGICANANDVESPTLDEQAEMPEFTSLKTFTGPEVPTVAGTVYTGVPLQYNPRSLPATVQRAYQPAPPSTPMLLVPPLQLPQTPRMSYPSPAPLRYASPSPRAQRYQCSPPAPVPVPATVPAPAPPTSPPQSPTIYRLPPGHTPLQFPPLPVPMTVPSYKPLHPADLSNISCLSAGIRPSTVTRSIPPLPNDSLLLVQPRDTSYSSIPPEFHFPSLQRVPRSPRYPVAEPPALYLPSNLSVLGPASHRSISAPPPRTHQLPPLPSYGAYQQRLPRLPSPQKWGPGMSSPAATLPLSHQPSLLASQSRDFSPSRPSQTQPAPQFLSPYKAGGANGSPRVGPARVISAVVNLPRSQSALPMARNSTPIQMRPLVDVRLAPNQPNMAANRISAASSTQRRARHCDLQMSECLELHCEGEQWWPEEPRSSIAGDGCDFPGRKQSQRTFTDTNTPRSGGASHHSSGCPPDFAYRPPSPSEEGVERQPSQPPPSPAYALLMAN